MKKKLFLVLLSVLVLVTFVGCGETTATVESQETEVNASNKTLKIGMDGSTEGFSVLNEKGELEGIEVDIWKEIADRNGYSVDFVQMPFSGLFSLLDDGRLDTVANCVSVTDARKEIYDFSDVYLYNEYVFLSNPSLNVTSLKELDDLSVAVVTGSAIADIIDNIEENENIKLERISFEDSGTDDLIMGKIDLTMQAISVASAQIDQIGEDKIKILIGTDSYTEIAYPFARSERGAEIKKLATDTLKEMREDGTLGQLSEKWFKVDLTEKK